MGVPGVNGDDAAVGYINTRARLRVGAGRSPAFDRDIAPFDPANRVWPGIGAHPSARAQAQH